jgi:hypothetical protein
MREMVPQQPAPNTAQAGDGQHVILPANDLGMHCADLGSYPLSILPPFNTVNAHAILKGTTGSNKPLILDPRSVTLKYSAASNINDPHVDHHQLELYLVQVVAAPFQPAD